MRRYMQVKLNGMLRLLQGLVSAMLWQALQLLDQPCAALHASHAEWPAQAAWPIWAEGDQPHEQGSHSAGEHVASLSRAGHNRLWWQLQKLGFLTAAALGLEQDRQVAHHKHVMKFCKIVVTALL